MTLFRDFSLTENDIKKNIIRGTQQKNGKRLGYFQVKNHRQKFFYIPGIKEDRAKAELKAIESLKYPLWHDKYIFDHPATTEEFLFYRKKINSKSAHYRLLKIVQFEKKYKLIRKTNRNHEINFLFWQLQERRRLHKLFVSEFGNLIEDINSKVSKGTHGRFCYIPVALRRYIIERDKKICQHCYKFTDDYQIDHIIPIAYGGPCHKWNLQYLCRKCNQLKLSSISFKDGTRALKNLGFSLEEKADY